jgi:hypothetical protein
MTRLIIFCLALFLTMPLMAEQGAEQTFAAAMQPIVAEYMQLCDILAADKTEGVAKAAEKIAELAGKLNAENIAGTYAHHYQKIPARIQAGVQKVAAAKDLEAIRAVLTELSKPIVLWVTLAKPSGIKIAYCSMKPGAWLQKDTVLRNPYYGSQMLHCGEIIAGD